VGSESEPSHTEGDLPELPEVETIVRDLRQRVVGRKIDSVQVHLDKIVRNGSRRLPKLLLEQAMVEVRRWGKHIIMKTESGNQIVVHLKMTGQFLWGGKSDEWPKHTHIIIGFKDGHALAYRDIRQFGYWLGFDRKGFAKWAAEQPTGPDPLELTDHEFAELLATKKGRIKGVLLNQGLISGLGNIYTDEALFAAGINPMCPANGVSSEHACQLHEHICRILEEAIRQRGSTVSDYVGLSGVGGQYQNQHKVYGRTGEACVCCGGPLERKIVAGRGTHFCPVCQPEP
jgi:formamidopyrimidine-DNA glycosylase